MGSRCVYFIIVIHIFSTMISASSPPQTQSVSHESGDQKSPITVNVYATQTLGPQNTINHNETLTNETHAASATDSHETSNQHTNIATNITAAITATYAMLQAASSQVYKTVAEHAKKATEKLSATASTSYSFLQAHKFKIFCSIIAAVYLTCATVLVIDNHYLNRPTLWGNWLPHLSYQELCNCPEENLRHELMLEIQRRYLQSDNPTNFITPVITFIKTITYEEKRIARYITYTNILNKLWLSPIFPMNAEKCLQAETALKRTELVHHTFLSWAAEYNMAHKKNRLPNFLIV
jgi:hypothetical protein